MVTWDAGRITTRDSVEVARPLTGTRLRDAYVQAVRRFTFGLARLTDNTTMIGPLVLLRFGKSSVTRTSVDWPIAGGLLVGAAGGRLHIQSSAGRVEANVTGYVPSLPRPLYVVSQLQVHLLFTRLFLLGLRGRDPLPGSVARPPDRIRSAEVDAAFCWMLTGITGRRSFKRLVAVSSVYHIACWSTTGRTLGGLVTRQRVVSVDGARLVPGQSLLRLVTLPISWVAWRPFHDEIAGTTVIEQ